MLCCVVLCSALFYVADLSRAVTSGVRIINTCLSVRSFSVCQSYGHRLNLNSIKVAKIGRNEDPAGRTRFVSKDLAVPWGEGL